MSRGLGISRNKACFSGAALYADSALCVSWSSVGLIFKLSGIDVDVSDMGGGVLRENCFIGVILHV